MGDRPHIIHYAEPRNGNNGCPRKKITEDEWVLNGEQRMIHDGKVDGSRELTWYDRQGGDMFGKSGYL